MKEECKCTDREIEREEEWSERTKIMKAIIYINAVPKLRLGPLTFFKKSWWIAIDFPLFLHAFGEYFHVFHRKHFVRIFIFSIFSWVRLIIMCIFQVQTEARATWLFFSHENRVWWHFCDSCLLHFMWRTSPNLSMLFIVIRNSTKQQLAKASHWMRWRKQLYRRDGDKFKSTRQSIREINLFVGLRPLQIFPSTYNTWNAE